MRTRSLMSSIVLLGTILVSCLSGCSTVGYGLGSVVGVSRKHAVAVSEVRSLQVGQYLWVGLASGEKVSGRIEALYLPDSLVLRPERASSDPIPGLYPRQPQSVSLSSVTKLEVAQPACRWVGLGVGAAVDVSVAYYVLTMDTSFKPATRTVDAP